MKKSLKDLILVGGLVSLLSGTIVAKNATLEQAIKYFDPDQEYVDIFYAPGKPNKKYQSCDEIELRIGDKAFMLYQNPKTGEIISAYLSEFEQSSVPGIKKAEGWLPKDTFVSENKKKKFLERFSEEELKKAKYHFLSREEMLKLKKLYEKAKKKILLW